MNAQEIIPFVLGMFILNNFLQTDLMMDFINRNFKVGLDLGLPTDEQMESRAAMSTAHSVVLVALAGTGVAAMLFTPLAKTISKTSSSAMGGK